MNCFVEQRLKKLLEEAWNLVKDWKEVNYRFWHRRVKTKGYEYEYLEVWDVQGRPYMRLVCRVRSENDPRYLKALEQSIRSSIKLNIHSALKELELLLDIIQQRESLR